MPSPRPFDSNQPRTSQRGWKYALLGAALVAALAFTVLAPALETADAAKGGNGGGGKKGGGGGTSYTGSFSLVVVSDADADGQLSHGDQITFNTTTNAAYYFVNLSCVTDSGGTFTQEVGFFPEWPWSRIFTLDHWYYWPAGGANCTAVFWASNSDGTNKQTLATMSLVVLP